MGARAGGTAKLRMRGSFIRMGSYYARIARRASYDSPPQFPGGTVARGTPTTYVPGALAWHNPEGNVKKRKSLVHSLISSDAFRKTRWYKSANREHSS